MLTVLGPSRIPVMLDTTAEPWDAESALILQLKLRLIDISPMIWRRVLVAASMTLEDLHGVFQVTMGWRSLHLYRFRIHAVHHGSWELGGEPPDRTLGSFKFRCGDRFAYEYDMIDFWQHEVRIEGWHEAQPAKRYPVCIGGRGVCPPEGCGGPAGYDVRRAEVLGIDALEDIDTMVDLLDRIVLQSQPRLLDDERVRRRLEDALERSRAREPFWQGCFDRRAVNARLRAGDHHVLKHQHLC